MKASQFIKRKIIEDSIKESRDLYKYYQEFLVQSNISMKEESFKRICRKVFNKEDIPNYYGIINKTEKESGDIDVTFLAPEKYKTTKDAARLSEINLDEYYPSEIVTNRWNTSGDSVCWQFKVRWKPIYKKNDLKPKDALLIFENLLSKNFSSKKIPKKINNPQGLTLELQIPDLHFGQLSWGEETGRPYFGDYDIRIAKDEFLKSVHHFYHKFKGQDVKQIIFPVGSDLFNVNNEMNQTANGTIQDEDCKPKKTFELVLETILESIDILKGICPNLDIIQIPGNHDNERIFYLLSALNQAFKNENSVLIDKDPSDRKYRLIGKTLLGLTHGKTKGKAIPLQNFPAIMADEVPELWGASIFREVHIGHIHHNKVMNSTLIDEFRGTIIRAVPSLAQIDYWHHSSGYRGTRQAHGYVYNDYFGLTDISIYNA
jgi:hypothetical protein